MLSPAGGYIDGGLLQPQNVVVDGLGIVYTSPGADQRAYQCRSRFVASNRLPTTSNDCYLASAIDGSGNYWASGSTTLFQWIGLANPVVTPVVKGVVNNTFGVRP